MSWFVSQVLRRFMPTSSSQSENSHDISLTPPRNNRNRKMLSVPLPLPEDILINILAYVPANDLLENCTFIKEWRHLIEGQNLWHIKCEIERRPIPKVDRAKMPKNFFRAVYFVPYGENLIKNPCGCNGFSDWEAFDENNYNMDSDTTFHGWIVENPPAGADPVPDSGDMQSCFATTYYWCKKAQTIDLLSAAGGVEEMLDEVKPPIEVSEWYAARYDCGSIYQLSVLLLDDKENVLDDFQFEHTETQWTGSKWEQVKHIFKDYPKGVRRLRFEHSGKDTQFWAGHFGSKMTKASVSFII